MISFNFEFKKTQQMFLKKKIFENEKTFKNFGWGFLQVALLVKSLHS